jgi:hypothetical protein
MKTFITLASGLASHHVQESKQRQGPPTKKGMFGLGAQLMTEPF